MSTVHIHAGLQLHIVQWGSLYLFPLAAGVEQNVTGKHFIDMFLLQNQYLVAPRSSAYLDSGSWPPKQWQVLVTYSNPVIQSDIGWLLPQALRHDCSSVAHHCRWKDAAVMMLTFLPWRWAEYLPGPLALVGMG